MKNTAINSIGYTGVVTLSRYTGSKKIKIAQIQNAGVQSLFNFLADCLLGDFAIAKNNRPDKIMLLERAVQDNNVTYTSCSDFIHVTSVEKVPSDSAGIVRYSFMVTSDRLANNSFNCIGLYANSVRSHYPADFSAIVEITDEVKNANLSVSSVLVVDWELNISNKEEKLINV